MGEGRRKKIKQRDREEDWREGGVGRRIREKRHERIGSQGETKTT